MDERMLKFAVLLGRAEALLDAWSDAGGTSYHLVRDAHAVLERAVDLFMGEVSAKATEAIETVKAEEP